MEWVSLLQPMLKYDANYSYGFIIVLITKRKVYKIVKLRLILWSIGYVVGPSTKKTLKNTYHY